MDTKNNLDTLVFQIEKVLSESGEKVAAEDKTKLEAAVAKAKEVLKTDDIDAIKKESEELQKLSSEVFTKLYQQTAGANPGNNGNNGNAGGDNVVDAEEV